MSYQVKQSTTAYPLVFLIVQSADHLTGLAGASPVPVLSKNGGGFVAASGSVTEIGGGWYKIAGNATDSNTLGPLILHLTVASGDPTDTVFEVIAYDPQDAVHLGLTSLPNTAVTTNASLLTSGTGTDQLSVTSGIAQANVEQWDSVAIAEPSTDGIPDVNVLNWRNGAVPAVSVTGVPKVDLADILGTAVSTPATAGILDVNVKNINNVAAATPGAAGGVFIAGANAATSVAGLTVTAGATITGSATGVGLTISGGGTSGAGLVVNSTSGDAVQLTPTAGHGVNIAANGTSKHGITSTGGTGGTSDGIKAVAGTGGVDIRGNITGNLVGTVSTLTTYTGNTPQTGDSFARIGAPVGASISADIAEIEGETDAIGTPAGASLAADIAALKTDLDAGVTVATVAGGASNIKKNQQLAGFMFLMTDSTNHNPSTGLTVTATRSLDGGAFAACANSVTEVSSGWYKITLAATDLNANTVALRFTAAASDDQDISLITQP